MIKAYIALFGKERAYRHAVPFDCPLQHALREGELVNDHFLPNSHILMVKRHKIVHNSTNDIRG
ncbi:hypothetical protein DIZ81_07550 [Legionella taurinensis]|uniref:Uncharacterized protein n=1 Tax=Legionella taurinensis TaxID=70611 RepID=A0AB38N868_9GAMM|nr:hypothetical protein DB744_07550 [Legionella taurinensis]PUT40469.1 hypothetical protein DB746_11290 [Legionella taurinensis]PUT42714.1 hypothetical protein DB743_11775 [Legionella taurinensis]PUT48501.1 hypothetical protein DB745_05950 [Legionella taurinensis]TID31829.1 hypothetical protein DIZ41_11775 [Legionella taurinensis]